MFSNNNRIRISIFNRATKFSPEFMIKILTFTNVSRYINSPTISIKWRTNPF